MPLKDIKPTEYYDQDNGGAIPVFRPTMEQFKDFKAFMEAIDSYGKLSGIVKVIPPKEWKDNLPDISEGLERVRVENPIIQHIIGSQGVYTQTNVEKRRPYTLNQWHALCEKTEHRLPDIGADRTSVVPVTQARKKKPSQEICDLPAPFANTRSKRKSASTLAPTTHLTSPPPSPKTSTSGIIKNKRQILAEEISLAESTKPVPLDFDSNCLNPERYDVEYCKELEREYWRNLTFSQPMYGADMVGTLFDTSVSSWNVNKLDNLLNRLGVTLPGVNTPYLYFGMWKSTFAWHVEDMDLYSINYLHVGAPKQWYSIPTTHSKKFEGVMQNIFFQQHKACHEFLRHKTFIASPKVLAHHAVPVHRCVQHEGEFMITFPFGYHSGYNLGFNCAESVNFAIDSWLEIGKQAKACNCINDSVMIDVSVLEESQSLHREPKNRVTKNIITKKKAKPKKKTLNNSENTQKCVLCSSDEPTDMITVEGSPVHQLCAEVIPDTYSEYTHDGASVVHGVKDIPNARWRLMCQYCHIPEGACTQCCSDRCCRAFHATCAKEAGATMVRQVTNNDGHVLYDVYCSQHDPKSREKREKEKQSFIDKMVVEMKIGRRVSIHWNGAESARGLIEYWNTAKQTCRIAFEDGISRTTPWRDIRFTL
ncbi:JmjC domain, hydroxylase-domain-containing protein [Phycomyces nitens]|nr:JmjC domain, hydroxylase-domain-containing protein [Phycomyces nitens]